MDKRFRPNYKMIFCGMLNGDVQTYLHKMVELNPSYGYSKVRCAHAIPVTVQDMFSAETLKEAIANHIQAFEDSIEDVELNQYYINGRYFVAGRCLGCGKIYYSRFDLP